MLTKVCLFASWGGGGVLGVYLDFRVPKRKNSGKIKDCIMYYVRYSLLHFDRLSDFNLYIYVYQVYFSFSCI